MRLLLLPALALIALGTAILLGKIEMDQRNRAPGRSTAARCASDRCG